MSDRVNANWREYDRRKRAAGDAAYLRSRRNSAFKTLYGITLDQAEEYMIAQWGMCMICETGISFQHEDRHHKACVDHDHKTGKVRGLLCSPCNVGLGNFDDDPARLKAALSYLERNN